jgi:hypothetical protein
MKQLLARYGIPQLYAYIATTLTGSAQQALGTVLPDQIGYIYGLGVTPAGTGPGAQTLITYAQTALLYLQLMKGSTMQLNGIRLDKLVYANANLSSILPASDARWLDVMIPGNISLDTSVYLNPTAIASGTIILDLYYLDNDMVAYLQGKGEIPMAISQRMRSQSGGGL